MRALRLISKIGLLLVIIGFFMPVSCDTNGFKLAKGLADGGLGKDTVFLGYILYVMFIAASIGVLWGGAALLAKARYSLALDWICLSAGLIPGLVAYLYVYLNLGRMQLQSGGQLIICGWIACLVFLIPGSFQARQNETTHE